MQLYVTRSKCYIIHTCAYDVITVSNKAVPRTNKKRNDLKHNMKNESVISSQRAIG